MAAAVVMDLEQKVKSKHESQTLAAKPGDMFKVIGGTSSGGIIVRMGKGLSAAEASERLSTGSHIRAVEYDTGRISYELVSGAGPAHGWVSMGKPGKALLRSMKKAAAVKEGTLANKALLWYSKRLAEAREVGMDDPAPVSEQRRCVQGSIHSRASSKGLELEVCPKKESEAKAAAEDSDGEKVVLCCQCRLPLGQGAYAKMEGKELMHAECTAQSLMRHLRTNEEASKNAEKAIKHSRREEFGIGWKVNTIPSNSASAQKLGVTTVPQGMCCLVLQGEGEVRVAPTLEPAGALNLEYLSLALQVRRTEGREPVFSLDPAVALQSVQEGDPAASMQMKRFEPEWLAGTSMGEVMFQADYHLKELSMGEYEQPVVGMKSCFDYSEQEGHDKEWSAREWFIVRKADVHVSEDNALVPLVKMGVEAREQFLGPNGLEDVPLTRPDHPLVKYAVAFTHNFDLIAERRSVISQLREVAKASVIAKFMMESGIKLDDPWFQVGEQVKTVCCLEVPQLWNDRSVTKIRLQEGRVVTAQQVQGSRIHSVYGGVDFGIDRFRLSAPSRIATSVVAGRAALGRPSSTLMATSQAGLSMGPTRQFTRLAAPLSARASLAAPSRLAAPLSARAGLAAPLSAMSAARPASALMATSRLSMGAPRAGLAAPLSAMSAARPASALMATSRLSMAAPQVATARLSMGMPKGVDLSLDQFNLSAAGEAGSWSGKIEAPEDAQHLAINGEAFWCNLHDSSTSIFAVEDKSLLADVFHPNLSDRQEEGERFMPPPTGLSYLQRLKTLLKEEATVRQQRQQHFFSSEFSTGSAGTLFPSSWSDSWEIEAKNVDGQTPGAPVQKWVDFSAHEALLQDVLATVVPVFDKTTEDGTRFLVYRVGSLEVRATQEPNGKRFVGAVFSVGTTAQNLPADGKGSQHANEDSQISKVTEYVEWSPCGALHSRSYVALETTQGHVIITEKRPDGKVVWAEGAAAAEVRNAAAKVVRSAKCEKGGITVGKLRSLWSREANRLPHASPSECKHYAQAAFCQAVGKSNMKLSGFRSM